MTGTTHTVVFLPSGKSGQFEKGSSVLQCAQKLGVDVDSVCGGRGICGRCKVRHVVGDFPKFGVVSDEDNVSPRCDAENRYDLRSGLDQDMRLSCHSQLLGDMVIDVPPESQLHKQCVRKQTDTRSVAIDPAIRLYYIDVEAASFDNPTGDLERLQEALVRQWNLPPNLPMGLLALKNLQKNLRKKNWHLTVAVQNDEKIITTWPGFHDRALGVSIDVGSTTIAATLCDLATGDVIAQMGLMNPQIRFGEDLMSRISFAMMNQGGADQLTTSVRQAMNQLLVDVCRDGGVDCDDVLALTCVGNPVMVQILLGLDPVELGGAPFACVSSSAFEVGAEMMGLHALRPSVPVYSPPAIAGHVGADAAAVVLSEAPYTSDKVSLIVDVGTNAEIILGNKQHLLAASSPTGPAFEGAELTCGQRASKGAIERVRLDRDTFAARYKVIGCDLWSDDAGFEDAIQDFGVTGICGSGIIEVIAEMFLSGLIDAKGTILPASGKNKPCIKADGRTWRYVIRPSDLEISITQNDVRAVQLAKAALYAGVRLLMDKFGISKVDCITLAGGFGNFIDPVYAMVLGLIPDCNLDKIKSVGNAAGTGARMLLLSLDARQELENVVKKIGKIETAIEADFQQHFVDAMAFPHARDAFPELAKVVQLPDNDHRSNTQPKRSNRRRR